MKEKKSHKNLGNMSNSQQPEIIDFTTMQSLHDSFHIEKYKEIYNSTPIPNKLKSKVQDSIQKGKKEHMKNQILKYSKIGGTTVAAALLTITILANTNPSISYAMEEIPIIKSITKVVTFRTYTDKHNNFEANIEIPQIETEENESINQGVSQVNKSVKEYTDELIAQYEADMKASNGEGNYAMDTSYQVITDTNKVFTLRIDTTIAMGGSNSFSKFYHINKETNETFELKDIFKDGFDYITLISDFIKNQMEEEMAKDESITYFYNNKDFSDSNFEAIKADQNFYFNEKGELVIVFDKYEVAPGYMGEVEFTIPQDITRDSMTISIN